MVSYNFVMVQQVQGRGGHLGTSPFYEVFLSKSECQIFESMLQATASSPGVGTITVAVTRENPNRLRPKADPLPAYEINAQPNYLKGDILSIQGRPSNSCNLCLSVKFGLPIFTAELVAAANHAHREVLIRVPSRTRPIVQFIPDTDPRFPRQPNDLNALDAAQVIGLEVEDFSDWEESR